MNWSVRSRARVQLAVGATIIAFSALHAAPAAGATYYVAANGNDSNAGTSRDAPWQHAPAMAGCADQCAAASPKPGDRFVLRGGDTWHDQRSGLLPAGIPWGPWGWAGTAANRIYIGVDDSTPDASGAKTTGWYNPQVCGASWCRPRLDGDNPPSTSVVQSCAYPGTSVFAFANDVVHHVTFDNVEILGACSEDTTGTTMLSMGCGTHDLTVSNLYFHGWTYTGTHGQRITAINGGTGGCPPWPITHNEFAFNVFDGSDSSPRSLTVLYGDCYRFHHNYMTHVCNFVCNNGHSMHDNVFEYFNASLAASEDHSNTMEYNAESYGEPTGANYFYDNVIRHVGSTAKIGVNLWFNHDAPMVTYYYNNVIFDVASSSNFWDVSGTGDNYIFNNTIQLDSRDPHVGGSNQWMPGGATIFAANNHYINADETAGAPYNPALPSNQLGPELDQSLTQASHGGAGYVAPNGYSPTDTYHPTSKTGENLAARCKQNQDPDLVPLCRSTTFGVGYDKVHHRAISPAVSTVARPSTGSWDIGAYQYAEGGVQPADAGAGAAGGADGAAPQAGSSGDAAVSRGTGGGSASPSAAPASGGCGCSVGARSSVFRAWALLAAIALVASGRRRRRRRCASG